MADHTIHISEAEAAGDFGKLLERVRAGAEVVIESDKLPVAVFVPPSRASGCSPNLCAWPGNTLPRLHWTPTSLAMSRQGLTAIVNR